MSSASHQDFVSALHHLHKINSLASRNGDKAVSVISAMIEALAHLQLSPNSDAIEQAQRCVAAARSHQLNDEIRNIPQLNTMIQMVDICCSLVEYDVNQSAQKLKVLQDMMDRNLNDEHWQSDGSFSIPLGGRSTGPSSVDTGHILHVEQGTLVLTFNWLHQADLYALCYFLSAVTLAAKNSFDGRKAEKFLDEGLRMIKGLALTAPRSSSHILTYEDRQLQVVRGSVGVRDECRDATRVAQDAVLQFSPAAGVPGLCSHRLGLRVANFD